MTDIELEMQARLSECRDNATKYEIVMIFLSAVTCLCLILTLYVTIRFLVSFRFMKKLFAVFLLMLNLALIGRFLYIVDEAFLNRPRHCENRSNCSEGLISYSGTFFFSLAGLLNIYNWLYFTVSFKTIFESRVLYKQKVKKIVSILFFPSILLIILLFSGGFIWSCAIPDASKGNFNNQVLIKYFSLVTCVIFLCIGIGFALAGRFIIAEIKLLNEDAGNRMKPKVYIAISILSIPFLIRSIYNLFSAIFNFDSEVMGPSISNNDWIAPIVYLIYILLVDIFPITTQLISIMIVLDRGKYYFQGLQTPENQRQGEMRNLSFPGGNNRYFNDSVSSNSEDLLDIHPIQTNTPSQTMSAKIRFGGDNSLLENSLSKSNEK